MRNGERMNDFEQNQQETNINNREAWNEQAYEAWKNKFGIPEDVAKKISKDPNKILSVLNDRFGPVSGKKIANIMGSNGTKAVALALLGADVTIFDYSLGNKLYAEELAKSAQVNIRYVLSDILELDNQELTQDYDIAFAEIGILHYFLDLEQFFGIISKLLKPDGKFILRDFHPVSNKLITSKGTTAKIRKHKVDGDYFSKELVESEISYEKYLPGETVKKVLLRKWNLGEIITAIAKSNLIIESLEEEPNLSCEVYDKGIPKTFTIVAKKVGEH